MSGGSGQQNPQNDSTLNDKAISSHASDVNLEKSETRHRVRTLEMTVKTLLRKIESIERQIKVVKKVTKDRKGNTIIVVGK